NAETSPSMPAADEPGGGFAKKWPVDKSDPVKSLPTPAQRDGDPLEYGYHLMDLTELGDGAAKKGDFKVAGKIYDGLARAVPDVSRPFIKLCEAYRRLGERQKAIEACTVALTRTGIRIADYRLYATVMLDRPGKLTDPEVADLMQVVEHLQTLPEAGA